MCRVASLSNGLRSGSALKWTKKSGEGASPLPSEKGELKMSIHDIAILLGIYIATIGAGALVGYIIDKSRKARR